MASTALTTQTGALSITETRMSVAQLVEQRKALYEVMTQAMKPDIDFGIIPGTPKPTLYKPGSEKILSMFHLGVRPQVEDLSTPDCIRYRVRCLIFHQQSGLDLGEGIGEASSAEAKYQWRSVICEEEWAATPDDRKRVKWKKGNPNSYSVRQVRADMEDVANTVLKMAKKRAQIDAVLTVTAASDIFSQDLEDLKELGLEPDAVGERTDPPAASTKPAHQQELERKTPPATTQPTQQRPSAASITAEQGKRFWAVAIARTGDYKAIMEYLKAVHGVTKKDDILGTRYNEAMVWAETGKVED